jgi:sulfur carrier protein
VIVVVNGDECDVPDGATVAALLETLDVPRRYVAVERNREIVPRALHETTSLAEGDRLEIVTMVGGG